MVTGSKPGEHRGGRKKGTPNKYTMDVRLMILKALDKVGGVDYLQGQAHENPAAFMSLIGKTLPKDVNVSATGGLALSIQLSKGTAPPK